MSKAKLNGENRVRQYLLGVGLQVERFSDAEIQKGRTPDFRVFANGKLAFYCEVKTSQEEIRLMFRGVPEGRIREEKLRVHLYPWFTEWKAGGRQMFFPAVRRSHHAALRRHFGVNPATLSPLPIQE
jgi:hypothetical protein